MITDQLIKCHLTGFPVVLCLFQDKHGPKHLDRQMGEGGGEGEMGHVDVLVTLKMLGSEVRGRYGQETERTKRKKGEKEQ